MRLLYLNHNVLWRSTFNRCLTFGRELVRRGHRVTLLTIHPTRRLTFETRRVDGVEVVATPDLTWGQARSGWDPWDTVARMLYLGPREFDLVHAFDSRPAVILPALQASHRLGIPLVLDWADWWGRGGVIAGRRSWFLRHVFAPIETWFEEAFRERADATTVISQALAERARGLGIPAERIHHLQGSVDTSIWSPRPEGEARRRLDLPADRPILLFAGFVHYDIDLVVDLFAEVRARRPDALLVLTGKRDPRVTARLRQHGCAAATVDRGYVDAELVPWYVAAADVCLVPFADTVANRGRWPGKTADYLAMGKAVVSNPVGEIARLFAETGCGVLADPEPGAMAAAVLDLLDDPARRAILGERARATAVERLGADRVTEGLERLYRGLTAGRAV